MVIACKYTFLSIVLLFLLAVRTSGQPTCKVEYYSTEQGLSHQAVTAMLKDREGFMWFGSWDGINRFDGHTFVSYKSSPGDHSKLGNDRIDQIVEDQAGHLWIQAYDRQVYRFDKETEQFQPLSAVIDSPGRQKIIFSKILSASNGRVWLQSAEAGLFCIPQHELTRGHFLQYKKNLAAAYRLPSNQISFFHEDSAHRIWIGTASGLCCLELSPSGAYKNSRLIPAGIAAGISLTACDEDGGNLYFGTAGGQLITWQKKSGKFSLLKMAAGSLNALLRSRKNDVLYATTSAGEVVTLELADQRITRARYTASGPLFTLYEDHTGTL